MQSPHDLYSNASRERRFKAGLVDVFLSMTILGLCRTLITYFFGPIEHSQLLNLFVGISYFVLPQHLTGQSIGKKMFDLKVVMESSGEKMSMFTALRRETFGKFISNIFLLGYISIIWRPDHKAWHDLMFKTRVITLTEEGEQTSLAHVLAYSFGSVVALCLVGIYVLFYTSVPLKEIADRLEQGGIRVEGIRGSIASGMSAKRISFSDETLEVDVNNVNFRYNGLMKAMKTANFEVKNLSAEHLKIKIIRNPAEKNPQQAAQQSAGKKPTMQRYGVNPDDLDDEDGQEVAVQPKVRKKEAKFIFDKFMIDELIVKDIDVEHVPSGLHKKFNEFGIYNLAYADRKFKTEYVGLEADAFRLVLGQLNFNWITGEYTASAEGFVGLGFYPTIAKNIAFGGAIEGLGTTLTMVNLSLFDQKVRIVNTKDLHYVLQMNDFSPQDYVTSALALKHIQSTTRFNVPSEILGEIFLHGTAQFGNANFSFEKQNEGSISQSAQPQNHFAVGFRGQDAMRIDFEKMNIQSLLGIANHPRISIETTKLMAPQDKLPYVYYGKNRVELSPQEAKLLANEVENFQSADGRVPASK